MNNPDGYFGLQPSIELEEEIWHSLTKIKELAD